MNDIQAGLYDLKCAQSCVEGNNICLNAWLWHRDAQVCIVTVDKAILVVARLLSSFCMFCYIGIFSVINISAAATNVNTPFDKKKPVWKALWQRPYKLRCHTTSSWHLLQKVHCRGPTAAAGTPVPAVNIRIMARGPIKIWHQNGSFWQNLREYFVKCNLQGIHLAHFESHRGNYCCLLPGCMAELKLILSLSTMSSSKELKMAKAWLFKDWREVKHQEATFDCNLWWLSFMPMPTLRHISSFLKLLQHNCVPATTLKL